MFALGALFQSCNEKRLVLCRGSLWTFDRQRVREATVQPGENAIKGVFTDDVFIISPFIKGALLLLM